MNIENGAQPDVFSGEVINADFLNSMKEAGELALSVRRKGLTSGIKSTKEDLVTQGDFAVSAMVQRKLLQLFPGITFIDEEVPKSDMIDVSQHAMVAIIDPIDGTTNYYNDGKKDSPESPANPNWGISVGIVKNGEIYAGAIYQPAVQKLFYAEKGRGAFVNGKRLQVTATKSLQDVRLIYDYPYPKDKKEFELTARVMEKLDSQVASAERLGSAVIEAMQVAEGKSDLFMLLRTQPWDVAAAVAIVMEAGGKSMNTTGEPYRIGNKSIIISNGVLDVSGLIHLIYKEIE